MFGLFKKKEKQENKNISKDNKDKKIIKKKQEQEKVKIKDNDFYGKNGKLSLIKIYDDIWSNETLLKGDAVIDDDVNLTPEQLRLGYGKVTTKNSIIKYYIVEDLPRYLETGVLEKIRNYVMSETIDVRLNYFVLTNPYTIDWDSKKMQRKRIIWGRQVKNSEIDVNDEFAMRDNKGAIESLQSKSLSYKYYNDADMVYHRSTHRVSIYFELIGPRDDLVDVEGGIRAFKKACAIYEIKVQEKKDDIYDWNRDKLPTALYSNDYVKTHTPEWVLTDDIISACLVNMGQGRIGEEGIPLGIDVESGLIVLKKIRAAENDAENILISGGTGSGKSFFMKNILTWLFKDMTIMVLDFEGDEYKNLAYFIEEGREGDAIKVDMSAATNSYFEPLRIADLTGEEEIDATLKEDAQEYTMSVFRILLGIDENPTSETLKKEQIISECIKNVYRMHTITDDRRTWARSKKLKIDMVYDELVRNLKTNIWKNVDDTRKHDLAVEMKDILKQYFVKGEANYGVFSNPINIEEIRDARFIVFSFGQKGKAQEKGKKNVKLQLKQLSVANLTSQIANYCKTVKKQFNVQVWEEFQRWIDLPGATDIIDNTITGGRKRGTINFILTNNLSSLLDENNKLLSKIRENLTGYCIGKVEDKATREKFCKMYGMELMLSTLDRIYSENKEGVSGIYNKAFACMFKGVSSKKIPETKCVCKALINDDVIESGILGGGVENITKAQQEEKNKESEENKEEKE